MLIYRSEARVLIFSMHEDTIFATRALQAGAAGYVTKASAPHVLVEAVHAVAAGNRYLSTDIAQKQTRREFASQRTERLSTRELEVLRWLAQGQTVKEVAESMGLSPKTVANHQSAIKQKLEADTAIELLRRVNELGLET
jgi:two-component system invasion response regulator UvrY